MDPARRPLRADAARKREQILAAAAEELADLAAAADESGRLSLDSIAARAGVGVATVYRHFPTREALLEAVYRHELDQLCDAAPAMAASGPADTALLGWMLRYVDFVESKRAMGEGLRWLVASGVVTQVDTRGRLSAAVTHFLQAGRASGVWRDQVLADDVVAAMFGATIGSAGEQRRQQTERLLRLLIDGLRREAKVEGSPRRRRSPGREAAVHKQIL